MGEAVRCGVRLSFLLKTGNCAYRVLPYSCVRHRVY